MQEKIDIRQSESIEKAIQALGEFLGYTPQPDQDYFLSQPTMDDDGVARVTMSFHSDDLDFTLEFEKTMKIWITIYPQDMSQESVSNAFLQAAATRFANELTSKVRAACPDAELDVDIRPASESGPDGGVSCEDRDVQEHVQHLYDQTFNQGNFWPEPEGYCIYCGHPVYTETAPAYDDDEGWADLALEHDEDCPWITTRAHQLEQ